MPGDSSGGSTNPGGSTTRANHYSSCSTPAHNSGTGTTSYFTGPAMAGSTKRKLRLYRSRSNTDSELTPSRSDMHDYAMPMDFRNRLYDLFGLIEKEFENLYAENYALRCKVGELSDRLANGESGHLVAAEILSEIEHVTLAEKPALPSGSKKGASHVGQKLKTAFKVPPGRLVSSFKAGVGVGSGDALRVRYVRPFQGHRDGVWDIGVSPHTTSPILGSASADQTARFWCIESGTCVAHYTGHSGSVNSIRFSPTENRPGEVTCVTACGDRVAHVFSISLPTPVPTGVGPSAASGICGGGQGNIGGAIGASSTNGPVSGGNIGGSSGGNKTQQPAQLTQLAGQSSAVTGGGGGAGGAPVVPPVQFYSQASEDEADKEGGGLDTDREEAGNDDSLIVVRSPSVELAGHSGVVIAADWLCSGDQVITASWDRTANIYDVERGEILNVLGGHDQELTHASAHSSQKLVVTSSKDFTFRLWDFRDPIHSVSVFQGHTESVTSAVFSSSDKVVSGSDDRTVKVWDLKNMRSALTTLRFDAPINRLSISAKHNVIAIPHDNRQVRLFDLNGTRIARLPRTNRRGHRRMVCGTAWADSYPTANLYTCGFDNMVLGWKYYHVTDTAKREKE